MISVAMTVYNGETYLKEQLDSILSQTRPADEIIIVDDCSTDHSSNILNDYQKQYKQIKLYTNTENLGYKKNFKRAIELTSGDHIFLSDQDDKWMPEKIETMMKIMEQNKNIKTLASSFTFMDKDSVPFEVKKRKGMSNNNLYLKEVEQDALVNVTFDEFCSHNYFQGCSLLFTKEIKELFLKNFTDILPHDWLIALMASYFGNYCFYNHPLFFYRIHDANAIGIPKGNKNEEWVRLEYAKDLVRSMTVIKNSFPDYWNNHPECQNRLRFAEDHIQAVEKRSISTLLRQNFDPVYWELKSPRARAMDIYFALTHLNKKGKLKK